MPKRPRATASDFDPEVLRLFDQYVHGDIDRRGFLAGASRFALGAAGAVGLLAALSPRFAAAQQVTPDDPRLSARRLSFESPDGHGTGSGYLVRPAQADGPLPVVLVVHENRGLNPHIEDVARRVALEGFIAFAPDALFPLGGYAGDEDAARTLFGRLDQAKCRADFLAAAVMLQGIDGGNGRLGVVGFCYGGSIAHFLSTRVPTLRAAAPARSMTCRGSAPSCWWCWPTTTNASMPAGPRIATRSTRPARRGRSTSRLPPSTDSTTTPRRATTPTPPSRHGGG